MVKLSVVINNYNYASFLADMLDRTFLQLQQEDELIVVDDGSTDDSVSILRQYQHDQRFKLITQKNQGQLAAVRAGIAAANGDIISLLDSDDYYLPGYLDRLRQIYTDHPDVSFIMTEPEVSGENGAGVQQTRRIIKNMGFPEGRVGSTRWSTLRFFEFVGIPTSGISMRTSLARQIMALPVEMDGSITIGKFTQKLFNLPEQDCKKMRLSADGVIVRAASLLDAVKYCNAQPGFLYRIHGGNKYATLPKISRWYARTNRKSYMIPKMCETFGLDTAPTASQLEHEIIGRAWPRSCKRALRFRILYSFLALRSTGSLSARASAVLAAMGLKRNKPVDPGF